MMLYRDPTRCAVLALLPTLAVVAACGDDTTTGPEEELGPGALQVVITTEGNATDPDGYTITFEGGAPEAVAVNDTLEFPDLEAGRYALEFAGNDGRCYLVENRTREAEVAAGETAVLEFRVVCYLRPIGFEADAANRPADGYTKIWVVDDDGSFPTQFGAGSVSAEPMWSSTGVLAYAFGDETTGLDELQLSVGDPGVLGARPETGFIQARPVAWSGDGSALAVYGGGEVRIRDVATGVHTDVDLGTQFGATMAATAPDGSALMLNPLFISDPGEVWIASFDGGTPTRIGDPATDYQCYAWSGDGTELYCEDWTGGYPVDLVALDVATGAQRTLVSSAQLATLGDVEYATPFAATPDGSRVLLSVVIGPFDDPDARTTVYSALPDGSDLTDLTQAPAGVFDRPHTYAQVRLWGPDTGELVFIRCDNTDGVGDCDTSVWAVQADGTGARKIFDIPGPGSGGWAQWLP